MSQTSANPTDECTRHRFSDPYYVVRCIHLGKRFVVETRNRISQFIAVDYVEDVSVADRAPMVIVDARDVSGSNPGREIVAEELWEELVGYLFADVGPAATRE